MTDRKTVLILGASYGSLLATKIAMAGHDAVLVCLPEEARRIAAEGITVRMPIRGREGKIDIASRDLPGRIGAAAPGDADPSAADLAALAMQEPQYRAAEIRALMGRIVQAGRPMMSIMNMPPLPYLARLPGLDVARLRQASADPAIWEAVPPELVTLASPDPQAFRPDPSDPTRLEVSLPTNFKVAAFEREEHTALLNLLATDIDAARLERGGESLSVPVKLRLHASPYVPLAKWAMLIAGNYRCIGERDMRPISEAVTGESVAAREIYDWVCAVCEGIGADPSDLVPFEKYAAAAEGLAKPSSVARALAAGATAVERIDRLVQAVARGLGRAHPELDAIVARTDAWIEGNRARAA